MGRSKQAGDIEKANLTADSLRMANEQLILASEFQQIQSDFQQFEDQQVYLKNDSLITQYNQARQRVSQLMNELKAEKKSNAANRDKIKRLEGEIATLKGIVKHYLEEIKRLGEENDGLKQQIATVEQRNERLNTQVQQTEARNKELDQTVQLAKKLNITGIQLAAYNKKGRTEKNITKATQLGVSFTISPNNTAAPGTKEIYARILTPEGSLLGAAGSLNYDGTKIGYTTKRSIEYANQELPVQIYWDVNTTLTPGTYTVEIFCDGYRLGVINRELKK